MSILTRDEILKEIQNEKILINKTSVVYGNKE